MKNQIKVKKLRKLFFDNSELYAVLFDEELTNKDARRALFEMEDQNAIFNYKKEGDCVLIWRRK